MAQVITPLYFFRILSFLGPSCLHFVLDYLLITQQVCYVVDFRILWHSCLISKYSTFFILRMAYRYPTMRECFGNWEFDCDGHFEDYYYFLLFLYYQNRFRVQIPNFDFKIVDLLLMHFGKQELDFLHLGDR